MNATFGSHASIEVLFLSKISRNRIWKKSQEKSILLLDDVKEANLTNYRQLQLLETISNIQTFINDRYSLII